MRKPIIAGNWKMNKTAEEAHAFIEAVKHAVPSNDKVDSVIGSPALYLEKMISDSKGTDLKVAAQNCYFEEEGAFTGEISPKAPTKISPYFGRKSFKGRFANGLRSVTSISINST